MRSTPAACAAVLLGLLLAVAPAATSSADAAPSYRSALVAEINAVRAQHGLARVRAVRPLTSAAASHSRRMVSRGFFAHGNFGARIRRVYRGAAGENLAWRTPDLAPEVAVAMWLASPGHRANLLDPRWREVGVGVATHGRAPGVYGGRAVVVVTAILGTRG